jgi:hypothetical protein
MSKHQPKDYTKVTTQDYNYNSLPDVIITDVVDLDKNGREVSHSTEYDYTADGGSSHHLYLAEYEYDKKGRVTKSTESWDDDAGGEFETVFTTENTFKKDLLVKTVRLEDYSNDGVIEANTTTTNTYNKKGQIQQILREYDGWNDGTVEGSELISYEYDNRSRLIKETYDNDNDGDADQTVTYTYKGGKSGDYTKVTSDDYTDDGIPESIVTQEYSLDKKGRPVSVTSTYDMDANGIPERGYIDQYTYDKQGRVTQYVLTSEEDGNIQYVSTTNTTYGKDGVTKIDTTVDYPGGGADYRHTVDNFYDRGLIQKSTVTWDSDLDGTADEVDTTTYTYSGRDLVREELDNFTDGQIEQVITYDYLTA